ASPGACFYAAPACRRQRAFRVTGTFHRSRTAGRRARGEMLAGIAGSPQAVESGGTLPVHGAMLFSRNEMPDDEKPKRTRSWREIDRGRDRGGSTKRSDREAERFQSSTKYTQYKTNLERLFSQGVATSALPDHLREKLGAEDDPEKDEERKKLYAIEDPKAFHAAATEFLAKHPM